MIGNGCIADGAEEHRVVRADDVQGVYRHHRARLVVTAGAPVELGPLEPETERIEDLARFGDDLGSGSVTRYDRDAVGRAARR